MSTRILAGSTLATLTLLVGREGIAIAQPPPTHPFPLAAVHSKAATALPPHARSLQLPVAFEAAGRERADEFLVRGTGYRLALSPTAATFQFARATVSSRKKETTRKRVAGQTDTLQMQLVGSKASAHVVQDATPTGHANYFLGRDRGKWRTEVPLYSSVHYSQVYRGVDLVYYGNQHQLEYDFLVRSGADPKQIALKFTGAQSVRIAANGDLVLGLQQGEVRWHKPLTYQTIAGKKRMVTSSFVLKKGGKVGFEVAHYDTSRALIIDPKLAYSKQLTGQGTQPTSLAVDSAGNTYLVGKTGDFPVTLGAFQTSPRSAFVAKLDPTGTKFLYATYLGGSYPSNDRLSGIAIDSQGNAYITGDTTGHDFPVTPGAFQTTSYAPVSDLFPGSTAFVTKLNPTGSALVYSTYLGGHVYDMGTAIALDSQGNAYVLGHTESADFPTTPGAFQTTRRAPIGIFTGFLTKLNPSGSGLVYSTYLGGSAATSGYGLALNGAGEAYVTGITKSRDFPVTPGAFQTVDPKPAANAVSTTANTPFVARLNAGGTALVYSTYLGGSDGYSEDSYSIALDTDGNAYVTGTTTSTDFPTTPGVFQSTAPARTVSSGLESSFVTKLNPTGTGLIYSTYMGNDTLVAIAIDGAGRANVTGYGSRIGFPTTIGALQRTTPPILGAVIMRLNASGTALLYASFLPGMTTGQGIAIDNQGVATVAGTKSVQRLSTHPIFPDFNSDGNTDLLLRNKNSGDIATWFMNGATVLGSNNFSLVPPLTFTLVGTGSFLADDSTTLVFQNSADNRVVFWYTSGTNNLHISGGDYVNQTPAAGWKLMSVADFNGDGISDLVFQNQTTGQIAFWYMSGPYYQGGTALSSLPGADWKVVGTGDFNGDGFTDLAFQNQTSGALKVWYMQGSTLVSENTVSPAPASGWKVVGVSDYNGDGYADLIFQNAVSNQGVVWYLNGTAYQGGGSLSFTPPSPWNIVGPR